MSQSGFANYRGNRRRFLESSAGMAAGMMSISGPRRSDPVRVAIIGTRNRGRQLAKRFAASSAASIAAVCDIDYAQASRCLTEVQQIAGSTGCRMEADYQRVLAAGDVDAVVIATPDHWHAKMCLESLDAAKHVFVEPPLAHTIDESRQILSAAATSERTVFCGLQQRSMAHVRSAIAHLQENRIGEVRLARAWTSHRRTSIGKAPDSPEPIGVDYQRWLGPAPARPFNPNRFHYSWRWFWDYGGGELTNWGVHLLDIARLGMNVSLPRDVVAVGGQYYISDDQETPDTLNVTYDYSDRAIVWEQRQWSPRQMEGRSAGVAFYGNRGTLIVDRGGWKIYDSEESSGLSEPGRGDTIVEDFLDAIRVGDRRLDDLKSAAISTDLCHLGNQAYRRSVS